MRRTCRFTIALLLVAACGTRRTGPPADVSGFLDDYSLLRKGGPDEVALLYRNPYAHWTSYDKGLGEAAGSRSTRCPRATCCDSSPTSRQPCADVSATASRWSMRHNLAPCESASRSPRHAARIPSSMCSVVGATVT